MRLDALTLELLRNYLHGAVEDMAYAVERSEQVRLEQDRAPRLLRAPLSVRAFARARAARA